jgi:hypothetical protein
MTSLPPTHKYPDTRSSCRLAAGKAQARLAPLNSQSVATQTAPNDMPFLPKPQRSHLTPAPTPVSQPSPRKFPELDAALKSHSACRSAAELPIAISCLGALWTPSHRARHWTASKNIHICGSCSSRQLVEQRLRVLQIARIEAFGEQAVDRSEQCASLIPLALIAPGPCHAHRLVHFGAKRGVDGPGDGLKVSVIVTSATPPTIAAKRATSAIPIVFAVSGDPVGSGLVASLARPGGNVTGLSIQSVDTVSKRVELLRNVVPNLHRLAVLANESNPMNRREAEEVQAAAHALGVEVAPLDVRRADDIAPVFAALDGHADALYVTADPLFGFNAISALALKPRLPDIHSLREWPDPWFFVSEGLPPVRRGSLGC